MVQCVSKYACSCMKKQLVNKLCEQGGAFLNIATHIQLSEVDIRVSVTTQSTFVAVKTRFEYTFTIPTSGNLLMQLGSAYRSALLPSNFSEVSRTIICLLMHGGFHSQCGLWPIIQIYLPGRTYIHIQGLLKDIEQVLHFKTVTTVTVSIFWGHWSRPIHWVNELSSLANCELALIHSLVTCKTICINSCNEAWSIYIYLAPISIKAQCIMCYPIGMYMSTLDAVCMRTSPLET